jgi:hypothetical protein
MSIERTPSETLMAALEEVETAKDLMIIVIEKDDSVAWHSTTDQLHRKLGMVEFVGECIRDDIRAVREKQ